MLRLYCIRIIYSYKTDVADAAVIVVNVRCGCYCKMIVKLGSKTFQFENQVRQFVFNSFIATTV